MKANNAASSNSTYGTVTCSSKRIPTKFSRPTLVRRNSSYFKNPAFRRKPPSPTNDSYTHSDAQWFLRLPDKVQRRHFTKEERCLLLGQTDTVVPDAADARLERELYKLNREANHSVPTLRTSSFSSLSSLSTFDLDPPVHSAVDMDESMIWFDDDKETDLDSKLQLDDYHEFINKTADNSRRSSSCRPSFRKALSLNSLPLGTNSSSPPRPSPIATSAPPLPTLKIPQEAHPRTISQVPPPTHMSKPSISTVQPSTCHYQDPEARLKLRVYLASPQKFDEAIEFGFPSLEEKEPLQLPLHRPSLSRAHYTAPCKTFLHDDNPSLFDALDYDGDESDDAASLPERDTPHTPIGSAFHTDATLLSPSSVAPSSRSSSTLFSKPIIQHHHASEPFAQALAGSREMTLRMTLTRPDLRADEKALYAHTTGDDPLALEHLPPTKKDGDIWDTLPKDRGFIRRFWRKVSGRS